MQQQQPDRKNCMAINFAYRLAHVRRQAHCVKGIIIHAVLNTDFTHCTVVSSSAVVGWCVLAGPAAHCYVYIAIKKHKNCG